MSETTNPAETYRAEQNGTSPAEQEEGLQLPEGAVRLPQEMVTVVTRLVQQHQQVQDVVYAYLRGKGLSGSYGLVLPVMVLLPQR